MKPKWISIDDQKPKKGQFVVYYFEPLGQFIGQYCRADVGGYKMDCFYGKHRHTESHPTHWMPVDWFVERVKAGKKIKWFKPPKLKEARHGKQRKGKEASSKD